MFFDVTAGVLRLHPCSCYFITVLNYSLRLYLNSLNKRGLPNQPLRRSRRQPTRDHTEIGIAQDLALVAELEEVAEVFL